MKRWCHACQDNKEREHVCKGMVRCQHHELHFERGGYIIACKSCGQAWGALDPMRLMPDYNLMRAGLSELDTRKNPFKT